MSLEKVLGIDLGTTNSCLACVANSDKSGIKVDIIENAEGKRTTPSVVSFTDDGKRLVGAAAKNQRTINPVNTVVRAKNFMGRKFSELRPEMIKNSPFPVVAGKNDEVVLKVGGKDLSPQEVSSYILSKIKETAETYFGHKVKKAVITVPAYFNDQQRHATKDAGEIAGLEVVRIINEPTAAALAYGLDKSKGDTKVAVFDLGGGTFDISVIEIAEIDGDKQYEVRSTSGDTQLGGEDFDDRVVQYLAAEFKAENAIDLASDVVAMQRLKEAAENVKIELSSAMETEVNLPFIIADTSGPKHLRKKLTRAKLEELVSELIERTLEPCRTAIKDAKLSISDINEVILVGGQTRMPKVQEVVQKFFGKKPRRDVNPDEAVAMGAAIQGGVLAGNVTDVLLLDVTPLSLGIETMGGVMTPIIEKNTTIPTKKSQIFSTAEDNQQAVTIRIFQGERPKAADNKLLGQFDLVGIKPAPRGVPQIEVSLDVDANSILQVSAVNKADGKAQSIKITEGGSLKDEEIERMKRDAETYAEKDRQFKELTESRNMADSMLYSTAKSLKEAGDKITADEKGQIEKAIEALKDALKGEKKEEIDAKVKELTEIASKFADRLYSSNTATADSGQTATESSGTQSQDDVVDAEFEELKDKQDN